MNRIEHAQSVIKTAFGTIIAADQNRLQEVRRVLDRQDEDIVEALKNPHHVWDI